jgi:hypothetical protein
MRKGEESDLDLRIGNLIAVTNESANPWPQLFERRLKPRLKEPFPARVWGVDSGGLPFNVNCVLENRLTANIALAIAINKHRFL